MLLHLKNYTFPLAAPTMKLGWAAFLLRQTSPGVSFLKVGATLAGRPVPAPNPPHQNQSPSHSRNTVEAARSMWQNHRRVKEQDFRRRGGGKAIF